MITKLKEIMRIKGLSQAALSRKANINQSQLNLALNGRQTFFRGWRKRIAEVLEMPEDELFPEFVKKEAE